MDQRHQREAVALGDAGGVTGEALREVAIDLRLNLEQQQNGLRLSVAGSHLDEFVAAQRVRRVNPEAGEFAVEDQRRLLPVDARVNVRKRVGRQVGEVVVGKILPGGVIGGDRQLHRVLHG